MGLYVGRYGASSGMPSKDGAEAAVRGTRAAGKWLREKSGLRINHVRDARLLREDELRVAC